MKFCFIKNVEMVFALFQLEMKANFEILKSNSDMELHWLVNSRTEQHNYYQ